jgi:hypothetical protein
LNPVVTAIPTAPDLRAIPISRNGSSPTTTVGFSADSGNPMSRKALTKAERDALGRAAFDITQLHVLSFCYVLIPWRAKFANRAERRRAPLWRVPGRLDPSSKYVLMIS